MKYIIVLLVVAVGLWFLLRARKAPLERDRATPPPAAKPDATPIPTAMVACAHCGLHLPQHDTLADGRGRLFCSAEHRDAGAP